MSELAERPRRADALRNRERVLAAATAVFAEKGLDAGIPEIAARAGVGKATVYRSFPTKEHLVAAIAAEGLRWWSSRLEEAIESEDPWTGLARAIEDATERQASNRVLAGSLGPIGDLPEVAEVRARSRNALGRLLELAKAQGKARPDASVDDVRVLFVGVARTLFEDEERDPAAWRRYGSLIVDALRA